MFMAVAVLVAAFVRGYSGFGFSALVVTAASLVADPLYFVAIVMFCELLMSVQQWPSIARDVDWRRVGALMIGAVVGVPVGLWFITQVSVDTARALISVYVLAMCGVMVLGWRLMRPQGMAAHAGVGTFAGLANAVGMAGLPVATYFTAQSLKASVFRATLIAYFALLDVFSMPILWWHGLVVRDTFVVLACATPLMGLGVWLGGRHFVRTDPQDFRRFAIGLLAVLASVGLAKAVL